MLEIWVIKTEGSLDNAKRSQLGKRAVRTLACRYLELNEEGIVFEKDEYGKPFLQGQEGFHFNISHSDRYVVCAVSDAPIGVDVEKIRQVRLKVAERFFTESEKQYVFSGESEEMKCSRFFTVWTRKEAFVKRDGRGLRIPLDSFEVLTPQSDVFYTGICKEDMICHICTGKEQAAEVKYFTEKELDKISAMCR